MRAWIAVIVMVLAGAAPARARSFDMEAVGRVLKQATPAFSRCATDHSLPPGAYHVKLVVEGRGSVALATVTGPDGMTAAGARCICRAYLGLRFRLFHDIITIHWPINLRY